jgi:hypothetical protein
MATLERGGTKTLDVVTFADKHGDKIVPERTSMLSAMYLANVADMLSRGFGRQLAKSISLTLVEFKNSETARQVSPWGSWTRAVPILDKNQKLKKLGGLTMELARSLGSCVYCPLKKCKKVRWFGCKLSRTKSPTGDRGP